MGPKYIPTVRQNKIKRECLKCSRPFNSNGVANRLCPQCNIANQTAPKLGATPVAQSDEKVYR